MLFWYVYVIVVFCITTHCVDGTNLIFIGMLIIFFDAIWMIVKCCLITCCVCFIMCLAFGFLALEGQENQ